MPKMLSNIGAISPRCRAKQELCQVAEARENAKGITLWAQFGSSRHGGERLRAPERQELAARRPAAAIDADASDPCVCAVLGGHARRPSRSGTALATYKDYVATSAKIPSFLGRRLLRVGAARGRKHSGRR